MVMVIVGILLERTSSEAKLSACQGGLTEIFVS